MFFVYVLFIFCDLQRTQKKNNLSVFIMCVFRIVIMQK